MEQEKFQKFVEETFEPERKNARRRAAANHRYYNRLLWAIAILSFLSAAVIAIDALVNSLPLKIIAGILSIAVTTLTGILKSKGYQEKATAYNRLRNDLGTEWDYYQARAGDYAKADDPEQLFVVRVRTLIKQGVDSTPDMTIPDDK